MSGRVIFGLIVAFVAILLGFYTNFLNLRCHGGIYQPHKYLATKTPYPLHQELANHQSHEICEPLQIWMVVRHGTRYPSAKVIRKIRTLLPSVRDQIVEAHEKGLGGLCETEIEALKVWTPPPNLTEEKEKILVEQGAKELKGIGKRLKQRFPQLLSKPYNKNDFKFKFTKTERAEASCKHFVGEIVGSQHASSVYYPEPLAADPILRFYKGCTKWKKEVDKNPEAYNERKKFETSTFFKTVGENLQKRSGLLGTIPLDAIETMYMTCAFDTAWHPETASPWCHLFDEDDLEKMQYRQDLEYYWIDGYGFELTYKQACPAIRDMAEHFLSKLENESSSPSLISYFTHSGTLLKLISRFGLFNDTTQLLHDNYHLHADRKWRTSEIDKFATNIAVVLYRCPEDGIKVGLFFQEQPIAIPDCGEDLCPIEKFLSLYKSVLEDCDMSQICEL